MITYELATELKEAGFPQKGYTGEGRSGCQHENDGIHKSGRIYTADLCRPTIYYSTLSELIEACGNGFHFLERQSGWFQAFRPDGSVFGKGETPEEAVARLWLSLNKKDGKD